MICSILVVSRHIVAPKNILGPFRPHFYEVKSPPFFQASKVEIMAVLTENNEVIALAKYIRRDFAFIFIGQSSRNVEIFARHIVAPKSILGPFRSIFIGQKSTYGYSRKLWVGLNIQT